MSNNALCASYGALLGEKSAFPGKSASKIT